MFIYINKKLAVDFINKCYENPTKSVFFSGQDKFKAKVWQLF